ncbi:DNA helicase [Ancylobacter defluvii]|uniref:Replicative DNA helicase n=1 Tax=Ancylobacter defluvii TaxID=1282440 RepID=A0A9W6K081_9HYPH|nr:DNA helicase [Ancylobacter defluvii]MBS7589714.1 AAA family ATPase [Ancylobacter defluvii]GLK85340.1 replicative DNA helicase [Ancylobacter defluvii]
MRLSAPLYQLKRRARLLSRREELPLHAALDRVAAEQGFASWSLLAAKAAMASPASKLFARLHPGDLLLVAARPGHGKTLLALELAVEAMTQGRPAMFFTLEYEERQVADRLRALGVEPSRFDGLFTCDCSDAISAGHVMAALASAPAGTLAVIDYLQLLDQKRSNPELMTQIRLLRAFARERQLMLVFLSQIDRSYDPAVKPLPDLTDVRLPNPLDLSLFSKACFLNDGAVRFHAVG